MAVAFPDAPVAVLAGPSFAKEVALGLVTGVTLASADKTLAERLASILSGDRFRIYTSDDPISATIGGAFKNVLAIACGITSARNMGENPRGLLIARGLYEMACIARAKGGNPVNLLGLAGSGDVTLTCMGTQSRNTTFGIALGKGRSPADILAERKAVTEGVATSASIAELGRRLRLFLLEERRRLLERLDRRGDALVLGDRHAFSPVSCAGGDAEAFRVDRLGEPEPPLHAPAGFGLDPDRLPFEQALASGGVRVHGDGIAQGIEPRSRPRSRTTPSPATCCARVGP